jgi:hypothetical protein
MQVCGGSQLKISQQHSHEFEIRDWRQEIRLLIVIHGIIILSSQPTPPKVLPSSKSTESSTRP